HRPEVAPGVDWRPAAIARPRRPAVAVPEEVLGLPQEGIATVPDLRRAEAFVSTISLIADRRRPCGGRAGARTECRVVAAPGRRSRAWSCRAGGPPLAAPSIARSGGAGARARA